MNASTRSQYDGPLEQLLSDYVALCNRAMAENKDRFWYRQARRLNRALLGGANFRTIVQGEDPDEVLGEFTIHFDPDDQVLSLLPPGNHDVAFSWRAPVGYLDDVVHERPEWYLERPMRLDWVWLKERMGKAADRVDGRSLAAGFVLGAAAVLLAVCAVPRERERLLPWR